MKSFNGMILKSVMLLVLSALCASAPLEAAGLEDSDAKQGSNGVSQSEGRREFEPSLDGKWIGEAICYGPYRENDSPGGQLPAVEDLKEDLDILSKRWNLIRLYGSSELAEDILGIIKSEQLPIRVMLGAWITRETEGKYGESDTLVPAAQQANQQEVASAIRLANAYPEIVIAVSVGNETQVFWSEHRVKPETLIGYLRTVREQTSVAVTTADDFNFWNKPESKAVAEEVDFIVNHIHPLWAGVILPDALKWTQRIHGEICKCHPDKLVVIGETGWATQVHNEGQQAELINGKAGEAEQLQYYNQFTEWANQEKVCAFFFSAFDEPWKGGPHPNEVEKHWGLYFVDRTPKAALSDGKPSE